MTALSVNVNKIAVLRNSRGHALPDPIEAARVAIAAGAKGITVHPRPDQRHIRSEDVIRMAAELASLNCKAAESGPNAHAVEFNIEGDPRPGQLIELCRRLAAPEVKAQATPARG